MWEEMEMWQFSLLSQQKVHPYYIKLKNKPFPQLKHLQNVWQSSNDIPQLIIVVNIREIPCAPYASSVYIP